MAEKMVVSTRSKMSGTSYHLLSMHDCRNEFLELATGNGEILVRGPSNGIRNGSSRIPYTFNTYNGEADHHASDTCVRTIAQIENAQHVGTETNLTDEKATQLGDHSESQIYTSTQQSEASSSLTLLNGGLELKNHEQFQHAKANRNTGVNFSLLSRKTGLLTCTHRQRSNSVVSRFGEITDDNDYEKPSPAEGNRKLAEQSAESSNSYTLPHFQRETMVSKEKVAAKSCKESIAEGHFEAYDHNQNVIRMDTLRHQLLTNTSSDEESDHQEEENAHARADKTVYTVASSVGSVGASNAQTHSNSRNEVYVQHYHQQGGKRKYLQGRDDTEVKRARHSKTHKFSDKRRRDKIRKKIRMLQQLVPCCKKMDKISVLDETIEYLKILQIQLQIMSMGRGLHMPSVNTMKPVTTSVVSQSTQSFFTRTTSGRDPTNGSSMSSKPAHFPCLQVDPITTAGIPGNIFQMFGFPWQMPVPLSIPQITHIPRLGNPENNQIQYSMFQEQANQLGEHNSSPFKTIF